MRIHGMKIAGIDIGSRTIEVVIMQEGKITEMLQADSGFDPMAKVESMIGSVNFDRIVVTGYGRHLFEISFDTPTITEIKAHALGVKMFFPGATTILDIGGQDSKVIKVNDEGKVLKFEMNDRCAAGTGKFLEIMANALGFDLEEFGNEALKAKRDLNINSMCTVFGESEVTSLVARGENRNEIARGVHRSVLKRAYSMLKRITYQENIVFSGGVANNPCMVAFLKEITQREVLVPEFPQMTGAIGAALYGEKG
jgi:predicted CoA-substrate-specific enzyme activase